MTDLNWSNSTLEKYKSQWLQSLQSWNHFYGIYLSMEYGIPMNLLMNF